MVIPSLDAQRNIDDSVNKLRKELVEPRRPNITFSNDYRKNNRGNTRFNVPRNQGYQPRGGYSNYNPRFNKPNYQQQNTSFSSYGNRFTQPYEQTFPKTHIEIMNQILNNNHHHNSNSHKVLASIHQVEITIYNKDNQNLTIFSNNQIK